MYKALLCDKVLHTHPTRWPAYVPSHQVASGHHGDLPLAHLLSGGTLLLCLSSGQGYHADGEWTHGLGQAACITDHRSIQADCPLRSRTTPPAAKSAP